MTLWGGRFEKSIDLEFKSFNDSLPFDHVLLKQDITGSKAWTFALLEAGIIGEEEQSTLFGALQEIETEYAEKLASVAEHDDEDIHAFVEAKLTEKVGALAKKLHTGRSRNDQVATDLRLWCKEQLDITSELMRSVIGAISGFAKKNIDIVFPGFTHLQKAQPILISHWILAYAQMLCRDLQRIEQVKENTAVCPLGSAALAGTSLAIDRQVLAERLGFSSISSNSIDAVSDRDFVLDYLYSASVCMLHLSRLAEDVIYYMSTDCRFLSLDDSLATGSSLMPQKKNPDVFELVRGKVGRVIGNLNSLMITMKGLPTAYNKDLQEDKECLFDTVKQLHQCLKMTSKAIESLRVNKSECQRSLKTGYLNATDLADYLVAKQIPFREAHEIVGKMIAFAENDQLALEEIDLKQMQQFSDKIGSDVYDFIEPEKIIQTKNVYGGTASMQVEQVLRELDEQFAIQKTPAPVVSAATLSDVDELEKLIAYWALKGENLPRARQEIISQIQEFLVIKDTETVLGCGSLFVYHDNLAEIRSLGISPEHLGAGLGKELVKAFLEKARQLDIKTVFVLTRVPKFFSSCGFVLSSKDSLPEKVMKDCQLCPKLHACDEVAMAFTCF